MADEYLAAIKALWTQDSASFQGTFVSFADVSRIRPASGPGRPHPPIWIGSASDAAIRRAVRFGDAWHPNRFAVSWLREDGIPRLKRVAADAGRHEWGWHMFATMAEKVFDLSKETVR